MKVRYEILPEHRLILKRCRGDFTLHDLMTSARSVWSDPRYCRSFDGIVDLTKADCGFHIEEVRSLVDFFLTHEKTSIGRWAAIASSPIVTAFALIYKRSLLDRHPFEVFSTWEAACEFLELDVSPVLLLGGWGDPQAGGR